MSRIYAVATIDLTSQSPKGFDEQDLRDYLARALRQIPGAVFGVEASKHMLIAVPKIDDRQIRKWDLGNGVLFQVDMPSPTMLNAKNFNKLRKYIDALEAEYKASKDE